jgi:hypothetical protein
VQLRSFLTSVLHGGEWLTSSSGCLTTGSWVGLRAGLDVFEKRKPLSLTGI